MKVLIRYLLLLFMVCLVAEDVTGCFALDENEIMDSWSKGETEKDEKDDERFYFSFDNHHNHPSFISTVWHIAQSDFQNAFAEQTLCHVAVHLDIYTPPPDL